MTEPSKLRRRWRDAALWVLALGVTAVIVGILVQNLLSGG